MRFTILVFLAASVACWFLRESRNFHTDGCWQDISVEGVVVGLQGVGRTGRASSRSGVALTSFPVLVCLGGGRGCPSRAVVTAVAEREIPFVREDLLWCTLYSAQTSILRVHYLSSGGRCSGIRHGFAPFRVINSRGPLELENPRLHHFTRGKLSYPKAIHTVLLSQYL